MTAGKHNKSFILVSSDSEVEDPKQTMQPALRLQNDSVPSDGTFWTLSLLNFLICFIGILKTTSLNIFASLSAIPMGLKDAKGQIKLSSP